MRTIWIVLPAVAAAAAVGFVLQRRLATPPAPAPTTTVQAAEGAVEADAAAPPQRVIPEMLPQFELTDRDGKARRLGEWSGRPLLVNFWATWCAPCRREIPLLNELRGSARLPKLEVIGIAVDFRDDVLAYAKETPINYPLLIGEEDGLAAVESFGMTAGFPFTVFADSQQRIVTVKIGELHRNEAELILDKLGGIDAGTLSMAQAKAQIDAGLQAMATARATEAAAAGAGQATL